MKTQILPAESAQAMSAALRELRGGGLVAFPTDTVYGVGAIAFDGQAVHSIYAAKGRPEEKAIPVLLGDMAQLDSVAVSIPEMALRLARRFWPGPLTLVLRRQPSLPAAVSSTDTVGVRVPDHPVARTLLRSSGPLAVTSANLSGQPSARTAEDVRRQLGGRIGLILDGGETPGGVPSTVLDCLHSPPIIVRAGPLALEEIYAALR